MLNAYLEQSCVNTAQAPSSELYVSLSAELFFFFPMKDVLYRWFIFKVRVELITKDSNI